MEPKFSQRVKEVISLAREEALRLGHDYIGTEHLILGMIREGEGLGLELIQKAGLNPEELRTSIENSTRGTATNTIKNLSNIPLTRQSEKVLKITHLEAKIFKSDVIGTEHLLLAVLRDDDNLGCQILNRYRINYKLIKEMLEYQLTGQEPTMERPDTDDDDKSFSGGSYGSQKADPKTGEKSRTPILDNWKRFD